MQGVAALGAALQSMGSDGLVPKGVSKPVVDAWKVGGLTRHTVRLSLGLTAAPGRLPLAPVL